MKVSIHANKINSLNKICRKSIVSASKWVYIEVMQVYMEKLSLISILCNVLY